MTKRIKGKTQRAVNALIVLLRNTTWKCGKIERDIINYLQDRIRGRSIPGVKVSELLNHFDLRGRKRSEFLDAIRRLERRRIVRLETP